MYLITSAAFIASELQSEFGPLPPVFLPAGNRRLFHYQLALIPEGEQVYITLPEGFSPGPYDTQALASRQIKILFVPVHLNLGESIVYSLNLIDLGPQEPLYLLHGDTLVNKLPSGTDLLGLSPVADNYDWAEYDQETGLLSHYHAEQAPRSNLIANGFFSFSSPKTLIRHIILANWNFINGLNGYQQDIGLAPFIFTQWYDFGHGHTYYQSKARMTTQRAFNEMKISGQVVTKASQKKFKLAAEANWYSSIPGPLRSYTPQLLTIEDTEGAFAYSIEYLHLTALNELYVFSQLPAFSWKKILKACCQFLLDAKQYPGPAQLTLNKLFSQKTAFRLKEFANQAPCDLTYPMVINGIEQISINHLAQSTQAFLPQDDGKTNVLHGDLCFSNILYDFRTCHIKVIDPRGITADDTQCIYGNSFYDVAKLAHSVIGLYDVIIAGYFDAQLNGQQLDFTLAITPQREQVITDFVQLIQEHFALNEVQLYAMQIQLFLSMLPLHSDRPDRQLGFIGNAYRLYDKLNSLTGKVQ